MDVNAVVEGLSDQGAVRAILRELGAQSVTFFGNGGKSFIRKNISGYNNAARFSPWFVLVDLDDVNKCPVEVLASWLPEPAEKMCFCIAVVELEAWLLSDREKCAEFLGVSRTRIPAAPDSIENPKLAMVNIARHSRKRDIREGLVPRVGSGVDVGPTYVSEISAFGDGLWRPRVAAQSSPSLARCIKKIELFCENGIW
jgi:hypothetical protein